MKRKCSIEGCERNYFGNGYCGMHYMRVRHGNLDMRVESLISPKGICNIIGCGQPHSAKGFCFKHYMRFKNTSEGGKQCNFSGCKRTHYAKGFCRKHHSMLLLKGKVEYKKRFFQCQAENCHNKGPYSLGYCNHHYNRFKAGIQFDSKLYETMKGPGNPRWNGGTSEYPNHHQMKKVRLEVLKEANYICHFCGNPSNEIHHKDLSKNNHSKENLVAVCRKCQMKFKKSYTSKFKRIYGLTFKELMEVGILKSSYYRDLK